MDFANNVFLFFAAACSAENWWPKILVFCVFLPNKRGARIGRTCFSLILSFRIDWSN